MIIKHTLTSLLLSFFLAVSFSPTSLAQDNGDDFFDDDFFDDDFFDDEDFAGEEIADPFEAFNRVMFSFNDKLYRGVLKPVAIGYRAIPEPARVSVDNFIDNLKSPISSVNALLQLDPEDSVTEISRFLINSTVGIGGLFDPAEKMGLTADIEDFGQTLGHYGIDFGFYLVIPFVGPSSLRDSLGSLANNTALNPLLKGLSAADLTALRLLDAETTLSLDKDTYEAFYDSSLDPYIFFRSAYMQSRAGQLEH